MLIVATGNGKGKTTAAIGQAIRAVGHGKRVFFAQFIKSDRWPSGEDAILQKMKARITFLKGGLGFVGILGDNLPFEEHRTAAGKTLDSAHKAIVSGNYGLVVLDEINVAIALKLVRLDEVLELIRSAPDDCDLVLTGRNADPQIIRQADFVTECCEVKHPFHKKVAAKQGLEY